MSRIIFVLYTPDIAEIDQLNAEYTLLKDQLKYQVSPVHKELIVDTAN